MDNQDCFDLLKSKDYIIINDNDFERIIKTLNEIIAICEKLIPFVDDGLSIYFEKIIEYANLIKEILV